MLVKLECFFDRYRKAWESGDGTVSEPECGGRYYGFGKLIDLKECINCSYLRGWLQEEE